MFKSEHDPKYAFRLTKHTAVLQHFSINCRVIAYTSFQICSAGLNGVFDQFKPNLQLIPISNLVLIIEMIHFTNLVVFSYYFFARIS